MRITQSMIVRNTLYRVNEHRENLYDINESLSTGKKVKNPSDNPAAFSRISRFKTSLMQNDQFLNNVKDANNWVDATSAGLDQLHSLLVDAREIASKAADGSVDAEIRSNYARKVDGMLDDAIAVGNSQYLGKNIFAGSETKLATPFVKGAAAVSYAGNDQEIQRKTSETTLVTINVDGQQLMDTGLFDAFINLRTALQNDDVTAIQNSMTELEAVAEDVLSLSSGTASFKNNLTLIEERLTASNLRLNRYIAEDEAIVLEEELTRFETEEMAYRAALQTASQIMRINIMEYIA